MRRIKVTASLNDSHESGGYIARTISKRMIASAPVTAWTQFYHVPYADDWGVAREKAIARCTRDCLAIYNTIKPECVAT